jgi:uncharacterized membrane protein YfcA
LGVDTATHALSILGAIAGALLKDILPDLFLSIMMVLLMTVTAYETFKKAYKVHQRENAEIRKALDCIGESTPLVDIPLTKFTIDEIDPEKHDENDSSRAAFVGGKAHVLVCSRYNVEPDIRWS